MSAISGAAIIQRILHLCLQEEDRRLLARLSTYPEFIERHAFLMDNPDPMPCEWMEFNDRLFTGGLKQFHLSAYDPAPGFSYHNEPHEHERRHRLIMLFGIPVWKSQYSWGDMLMWAVSFREHMAFSGLADWADKEREKAVANGAAEWRTDENGQVSFHWKTP